MDYFAALTQKNGRNPLPYNPCRLLDFELLVLSKGESAAGSCGDRETAAVILGGQATFRVGDHTFATLGERANVFDGKPTTVYLPAGSTYEITADSDVQIALASAPSDLECDPYVILPEKVIAGVWGYDNHTRHFHQILVESVQPDLPARRLIVGETFTPSGNWSTYPAHKHEVDNLPDEAYHEEMYYFRVAPADGFGITRFYRGESGAVNYTVTDNSILMLPHGYHTYVGAPGFQSYYLWFLAGEHRTQAVQADAVQMRALEALKN
ncbi:MAG: 5-deoxy-glucuronate isomerase [Ardenticatenaceae bacterium]|nr:5-deoxy-glucuronate isomerase [Ardenticatenaceae bacterium]